MTERRYADAPDDLRAFVATAHGEDRYREFEVAVPSNERIARQVAGSPWTAAATASG